MAVGTVSGIAPEDNWQLIETTTISSGTASYTYSNLSGYKTILIAGRNIVKSVSNYSVLRINGDTASGSYAQNSQSGGASWFYVTGDANTSHALAVVVHNINQSAPHKVDANYGGGGTSEESCYYTNPVPITSLQLRLHSSATFSSGTIYVYGIPA